jgi:hypothetical protein
MLRNERGAVAVEMAIVAPVLVLLAFGMLEFGLVFKAKLTISHAVNQATRQATVMGTNPAADIEILRALEAGLDGRKVERVDIFRADADGLPEVRNRYVPDGSPCGWQPCPDPNPGPAVYGNPDDYKPCTREVSLNAGVDSIGVQVQYKHTWITGVLGIPDQLWFETARANLEPDLFGTGASPCP